MIAVVQPETTPTPAAAPGAEELIRAHYRLQHGRFLIDTERRENCVHCASDVRAPMWNHSAWLDEDESGLPAFIAEAEDWHKRHERRPIVYLTEAPNEILPRAGYEKFDRETWMLRRCESTDAPASDFITEPAADLAEFARIFRAAFNASSAAYETALRREPSNDTLQKHFIARRGTEAAAVGSIAIDGEIACIYNVGTAPSWRGRGAGRALVEGLIDAARKEGCRWIFLQVETGSVAERLYARLGFKALFTRVGFRKTDWTPGPEKAESLLSKALGFRGRTSASASSEGRESRVVPVEVSEALERLSRREGLSPERLVMGLWGILLARYTSQSEVTFHVRLPGAPWETVRREIRPDSTIVTALKQPNLPPESDQASAETGVCFGSSKNGSGHSLLLGVPCLPLSTLELTYRAELFSKDSIRRMANHFLTLLGSLAANPQNRVQELEMLTAGEREELLNEWSRGGEVAWNGESIIDLIESAAQRDPNALALVLAQMDDNEKNLRLTYRELLARAAERTTALMRYGVAPGTAVCVLLPRSLEVVVSILAIWRAGAVFVPLDHSYPAERLAFMIADSRAKVVITNNELGASLSAETPKLLIDAPGKCEPCAAVRVEPNDPAYIIYTSGSTGKPKGVTIHHGALARHVLAAIDFYEITTRDRHLHFSPFTFDASFEQLLPPLAAGASVVIRDERLWDVSEFIRNLSAFKLTMIDVPVAYWHQLAAHAVGLPAQEIPAQLRLVIAGGEAMSADRLAQWQQGPFGDRRLVNAYGPTEATITATAFDAANFKAAEASGCSVPIGRPLAGRSVFILNDSLQPVPIRVVGQLYLGGPLLAQGYVNRAELTRERFIPNPFGEGRLYSTGDLARYLEDGTIEFLGRTDDQVKIRGFRVELGEIESALQEHPSVREAVVVARDDGAGQKRLIAYVTPRGDKTTERELRNWLRSRLPEYMTPGAIMVVDQFPLLNSGKVNRKALPDAEVSAPRSAAIPQTPLELQLQILFQRVLRRSGLGVDESFFELGGDSLQALELIVQIEKATGRRLPLETLFETPTVQRLAAELQRTTQRDEWSSLAPLQKTGTKPPLYLVHTTPGDVLGYGNLIHHLGADQPCYGFQALGLKDGAEPHESIESMAAHYVRLLQQFQPHGPYYLGGWCFGGIVAVEMAQQLQEAGEEVAALLLLETISVSPGGRCWGYHFERLKCLVTMSPGRWKEYLRAKARYRRQVEMDNRMRFRQAGDNVDPEQRRWLARLEQVYNANLAALDSYRSRYYRGKVTLFNAVERDPGILPDPNYGWRGLADEIEIYEVAGNHDTMLAEPNVSSLADAMRKALAKK